MQNVISEATHRRRILSILLPLALWICNSTAGSAGRPRIVIPQAELTWATEAWTGDDQPYQEMRDQIDALAIAGKLTADVIASYQKKNAAMPHDPKTVFRYAYAFYRGNQLQPQVNPGHTLTDLVFEAAPSPHAPDYDRARFLTDAPYDQWPQYVDIARRLLKLDPGDYDVEYYIVVCLQPWASDVNKHEALVYAHDLIRRHPNDAGAYNTLGYVYFSKWISRPDRYDAQEAIMAYQKCLQVAPPDYRFRDWIQNSIQNMTNYLNS